MSKNVVKKVIVQNVEKFDEKSHSIECRNISQKSHSIECRNISQKKSQYSIEKPKKYPQFAMQCTMCNDKMHL